jgi:hypothetical protein
MPSGRHGQIYDPNLNAFTNVLISMVNHAAFVENVVGFFFLDSSNGYELGRM